MQHILEQSYKWEKGYVNDPDDLGGATKDGITHKHFRLFAAEVLGKAPLWRTFEKLSKEDVLKFYQRIYRRLGCDRIEHPSVAAACFDFALNSGYGKREIQEVLAEEFEQPIAVDNVFGPATVGALNAVTDTEGSEKLVTAIMDKRQAYVESLVARRANQAKFLKGWTNRIEDMRNFCADLIEQENNKRTDDRNDATATGRKRQKLG